MLCGLRTIFEEYLLVAASRSTRRCLHFTCPQRTSVDYYKVICAMLWFLASFFLYHKAEKVSDISFLGVFQIMVFKWKMISNDKICSEKTLCSENIFIFPTHCLWHHIFLYLPENIIFLDFEDIVFYWKLVSTQRAT